MSHSSMKHNRTNLQKRKRRIEKRLCRKQWENQPKPIMTASNIHYEVGAKTAAINYGGIGAIHQLVKRIGLEHEINENLDLLKYHVPYYESDHVLNIAYNVLVGGLRLDDIELRRNDEAYLNALGAQRIPDPTTAGDFTRRFDEDSLSMLMESINNCRKKIWKSQGKKRLDNALIDVDGTYAPTLGQCKAGMDISYKGMWGYHPLVISLANTKEILYLVNRPGNATSHSGAADWIDKAIDLVGEHAKRICLRGDTDFSLTRHFDRWSAKADFIFGMDCNRAFVKKSEKLPKSAWKVFNRKAKYEAATGERTRPDNVKQKIVREREYKNLCLNSEEIAEFNHRPARSSKTYRMIVLRKNLSIGKGDKVLFDDIRYFFYITTKEDLSAQEVVELANV